MFPVLFTRVNIEQQFLRKFPKKPGIYRFLNENHEIIYVGASSNLRKRIGQHFMNITDGDRNHILIRRFTKFIEYLCYATMASAFEAEKVEIWTHKPRFNRRGVIARAFSYLIFRKSPFLQLVCLPSSDYEKIKDDDEFYRLNMHCLQLQQKLETIRKQIPFCFPSFVCWDHHLGLCYNSCRSDNSIVNEQYIAQIELIIQAISGTKEALINEWERSLAKYVETLEFEAAKKLYAALKSIKELELKFCGKGLIRSTDKFIFKRINKRKYRVKIVFYREQKVVSKTYEEINFTNGMDQEHHISTFLHDFYKKSGSAPQNIQINVLLSSNFRMSFLKWLKRYYGKVVSLNEIS